MIRTHQMHSYRRRSPGRAVLRCSRPGCKSRAEHVTGYEKEAHKEGTELRLLQVWGARSLAWERQGGTAGSRGKAISYRRLWKQSQAPAAMGRGARVVGCFGEALLRQPACGKPLSHLAAAACYDEFIVSRP